MKSKKKSAKTKSKSKSKGKSKGKKLPKVSLGQKSKDLDEKVLSIDFLEPFPPVYNKLPASQFDSDLATVGECVDSKEVNKHAGSSFQSFLDEEDKLEKQEEQTENKGSWVDSFMKIFGFRRSK